MKKMSSCDANNANDGNSNSMMGQAATSYRILLTANDVKNLREKGLFVNGYYTNVTQVNLLRRGIAPAQ
jgi:hypothetical protein